MYHTSGNYEAFLKPRKNPDADRKSAYIIGSGLAALSAAAFLIRDAYVDGSRIHIIEKDKLLGGACDGFFYERLLLSVETTIVPYTPQEPRVYNLVGLYGIWFKSKVGKANSYFIATRGICLI